MKVSQLHSEIGNENWNAERRNVEIYNELRKRKMWRKAQDEGQKRKKKEKKVICKCVFEGDTKDKKNTKNVEM